MSSTADAKMASQSGCQIEARQFDVQWKQSQSQSGLLDRGFQTDAGQFDSRNLNLEAGQVKLE